MVEELATWWEVSEDDVEGVDTASDVLLPLHLGNDGMWTTMCALANSDVSESLSFWTEDMDGVITPGIGTQISYYKYYCQVDQNVCWESRNGFTWWLPVSSIA
jgi:hypothetical protein